MTVDAMMDILREMLSPGRFAHTVGVAQTACSLALQHSEDTEKAYLAGLLHDCAKYMSGEEMLRFAQESQMSIDAVEHAIPTLLHARIGRILARERFGVTDCAVLNAIERHLFGAPDMTDLDMIVNIADYIEPGRNFAEVEKLRVLATQGNLCETLIACFRGTMCAELNEGGLIHPAMLITYNALLQKMGV